MSTNVGEWFEWTEDHPLEIIKHRSRLVFHNTSDCVSWETEGEEGDRLWSGPEWDAFCDAHDSKDRAQLAEAKAVLTKHQWSAPDERCPECGGHEWRQGYHEKEQGHAPDCRLAKAIGE